MFPADNVKNNINFEKISDHGVIFNNRTAALIGKDGTVDWACFPNFDSKPVFDSILDIKNGGFFITKPLYENLEYNQYYEELTNILVTEFLRNSEVIMKLTDFLPISEYSTINFPEIHRRIDVPNQDVDISILFKPNFNYGREKPEITRKKYGYIFNGIDNDVGISSNLELHEDQGIVFGNKITLKKGMQEWIVVSSGISHLNKITDFRPNERLEDTRKYWKNWTKGINYEGIYHNHIIRSALTLKGLFYEPTGMMVAAPTSSLPEAIGGDRNWDYRFTWIRDTSYVIDALSVIGLKEAATNFLYDLMHKIQRDRKIKTIYEINSGNSLNEEIVPYEGYMNSRPVRIGNGASSQFQLDQYGSIINSIYHFNLAGGIITVHLWDFVLEILEKLEVIWKRPDSSIWEFRTEPKHYVYSKLISWLGFHRAISMGKKLGYTAPYRKWKKMEDEIKNDIIKNGYNPRINSFVQYYGSDTVDASLLRLPLMDFLPPDDKKVAGTIQKIEKELMVNGYLFKRYNEDDGLKSRDNAFLLLTFWYIEDLVLMNRLDEAQSVLDNILGKSNHLLLFSEEMDIKTEELIGNFPQGITHLGVIRSIIKLNEQLKNKTHKKI